MPDDQRLYSDEEFALILRRAAELASGAETPTSASAGLTLTEMKAAAAQVGLDPVHVEQAARQLATKRTASPLELLIGGPLRYDHRARFPITLDESSAARLLSAVRISAGATGTGHSSSMGMTWNAGGDEDALSVIARSDESSTSVSVALDRHGTLVTVAAVSAMGIITSFLGGLGFYEAAPALGLGLTITGVGGVLAAARGYWASSTRKLREQIGGVMDDIAKTLSQDDG